MCMFYVDAVCNKQMTRKVLLARTALDNQIQREKCYWPEQQWLIRYNDKSVIGQNSIG